MSNTFVRIAVVFFLALVLSGAWIGIWNHQQIQTCQEQDDANSDDFIDCEDPFSDIARGISLLLICVGGIGGVAAYYRWYR
ncbi:hypothetical protein ACFQJC_02875 [Haloferax namakaokahaiae]|uniref:Uncharacterized protein n=1 Tax=Haloferax namakaokahaiae TaxID=1748331 RepID=A0ABD5ZB65_9EURY